MGNKVVFFGSRPLNSSMELNDWLNVKVDLYYTDTCVALNAYNVSGGVALYEVEYGSYAETRRIVPPTIPPFIRFEEPTHTFK
jgi:hypothetical protein